MQNIIFSADIREISSCIMSYSSTTFSSHRIATRWKLSFRERYFSSGKNKSRKSYDIGAEGSERILRWGGARRSFLCKVRIERRICSSPSAVFAFNVPPGTFLHSTEVSLAFFVRRDSPAFALRPPVFRVRRALLHGAPRVKGSQYRGFPSKFLKPRIKRRMELCWWQEG